MREDVKKYTVKSIALAAVCFIFLSMAALCVCLMPDKVAAHAFAVDERTVAQYEINSADDLAELAENVNKGLNDGYYGITFVLTKDISLSDICRTIDGEYGWMPIGSVTYPFKGTFDGAGYSITGLSVNRDDSERIGLFGETNANATIQNLTVEGSVKGGNYTAGIAGYNQGVLKNCTSNVTVTAKNGSMHVGGIVGYNKGTVSRSYNNGSFNLGFVTMTGGIAGSNAGMIEKCCNTSDIVSVSPMIGGIAGNSVTGGVIQTCMNTGKISGKSAIGGISGNNGGNIKNVFNRGDINSNVGTAGGITGSNEPSGSISYTLNVAAVEGVEDTAAVCGFNLGVVSKSFYDSSVFSGLIVNGLSAEDSRGLTTRVAVHCDVLSNSDKMGLLSGGGNDSWIKRNTDAEYCYYPELKYFFENSSSAPEYSRTLRSRLTDEDVSVNETQFVYNGKTREVDLYYGKIQLELNQDYTVGYSDNINCGTARAVFTFINGYIGTAVKEFSITQAELTVAWDNLKFTYNGLMQTPKLVITDGLINEENVSFSYDTEVSPSVGIYEITACLEDTAINANYYLPLTKTRFEIVKSPITIFWSDEAFIYNGEAQVPIASVLSGRIGEENITFRYEYQENIKAGNQTVDVFLEDTETNGNYFFKGETYSYVIGQKPVTVVWTDIPLYYNGAAQFPTAEVASGRIGEEDVAFVYTDYEGNIKANEEEGYTVNICLADTETNKNYYFPAESRKYYIYKTELTIGWWDTPLTYTGYAQYPAFYIESGRIGAENVTFSVSDYSGNIIASEGGKYKIEVTLEDTEINDNYFFTPVQKEYDISKADFNPQNMIEFPSCTFGYDGEAKSIFIDGDLPVGVTVEYENNSVIEEGEYTIYARFKIDSENYNPLKTDSLVSKIFIVNMAYTDMTSGITVTNKALADYSLKLKISEGGSSSFKQNSKKVLADYFVEFNDGLAEYSVPMSEKQLKSKGIKVLYKNSEGNVYEAEYAVVNGNIVFTAEGLSEFAVVADVNLLPLWIGLPVGAIVVGVIVCFIVMRRKQRICAQYVTESAVVDVEPCLESETGEQECAVFESKQEQPDISFKLDGVYCLNYNWFEKSLRFKKVEKQKLICAGNEDALLLSESIPKNAVYWLGEKYKINSAAYKKLMERVREAIK